MSQLDRDVCVGISSEMKLLGNAATATRRRETQLNVARTQVSIQKTFSICTFLQISNKLQYFSFSLCTCIVLSFFIKNNRVIKLFNSFTIEMITFFDVLIKHFFFLLTPRLWEHFTQVINSSLNKLLQIASTTVNLLFC